MTENMAARGEGLAGLVAQPARRELYSALVSELRGTILISSPTWRCPTNEEAHHMANAAIRIVEHFVQWVEALMKVEGERAIFALEAAAPAGTAPLRYCGTCNLRRYFVNGECEVCSSVARPSRTVGCTASDDCIHECPVSEPESRLDEFKTTVIALCDPELNAEQKTAYIAARSKELREAALATPSPQAPPEHREWIDVAKEQGCECGFSDAWRCARKKGITTSLTCYCPCHKYISAPAGSPRKVGEDGPVTEQLSKARASALAQFTDYFVRNYPGPDTIIFKPTWHAPRIFSAAYGAILDALRSSSVPVGEQKD